MMNKQKDSLDADYESLPQIFKNRIYQFRTLNPEFRVKYESYEMFCCKEAVKISAAFSTSEEIDSFAKLSHEEQIKSVQLGDGHSGNTFAFACFLAKTYIDSPNYITKINGALAPLVGSEEYAGNKK